MILALEVVEQLDVVHPDIAQMESWVAHALACARLTQVLSDLNSAGKPVEIGLRLVDKNESAELNTAFRKKNGPTNILSFPYDAASTESLPVYLLGDLVVCAPLVAEEAGQQNKSILAHWAHLLLHGVLHLLGFDHIAEADAADMEALEIELLGELGFANPYD